MSDQPDGGDDDAVFLQGAAAPVTTYMSEAVVTVPPTATLREVAAAISAETVGLVVVGTEDQVEGVVSERDIAVAAGRGDDLDTVTAGELDNGGLVWVGADSTIEDVVAQMMQGYVRHVLVGDGRRLVGVVSIRDVVVALAAM